MSEEKLSTKITPQSKESEMMVLGCMLSSVNALNTGADNLLEQDFYYLEHKLVFNALKKAYINDKPADIHLIAEDLKSSAKLADVGGVAYLTTLAQYAGTSAYIEEYIEIVKNKSLLRQMIEASKTIEKSSMEGKLDVATILDDAQALFFNISQSANSDIGKTISDVLNGTQSSTGLPYLKELQDRQEKFHEREPGQSPITGLPTNFYDLDMMINGLNNSQLLILAARPSMGKTALALNIAEHVCFNSKKPIAIFSLEMTAEELIHRLICSQAEVESDKIRTGSLDGVEYQRIVATINDMQKHTLLIDDQPGLKISDLRARARRLKEVYDIQLLIVDYLQLLSGSRSNYTSDNRQNEISEISRNLKTLARELNIPLICLSQLSRKVEERAGHRPMLSDLRESGCLAPDTIIQDADTGKLYTIKELADRKKQTPINVFALNEDLTVSKHVMSKVFYSGKKKVYKLTTKSGKSIKASANHPFKILDKWEKLENLSVGDQIAVLNKSQTEHLDLLWDSITSIKEMNEEDVYDATVEGVHNFIANEIIVHNSIEQDADIVMFLFRPEYYNSQHKPGLAELIISKNRHGKVGNVPLTFRKSIAQFQNYTPVSETETSNDEAFAAFSPDSE